MLINSRIVWQPIELCPRSTIIIVVAVVATAVDVVSFELQLVAI